MSEDHINEEQTNKPGYDMKHPATWLATWFGAGFMRPAPGTFGSLAAIPFAVILYEIADWPALLIAASTLYPLATWSARIFGAATGNHDDKMIVIDEVIGQWIALAPLFAIAGNAAPIPTLLGFILFRLFDIKKPWPVSYFDQKMHNAHGVMLDDVAAGILAGLFGAGIIIGANYAGYL